MTEQHSNNQIFLDAIDSVTDSYQKAFKGFPWFENLPAEVVKKRILTDIKRPGFTAFTLVDSSGSIKAALWYDIPNFDQLIQERGKELATFASDTMVSQKIQHMIWEREVLVDPEYQGRGLASSLRKRCKAYLEETYPTGVLILTRMRDDNAGIIKIAQNVGFMRTGIKMPSTSNTQIKHEYWYNIVKKN